MEAVRTELGMFPPWLSRLHTLTLALLSSLQGFAAGNGPSPTEPAHPRVPGACHSSQGTASHTAHGLAPI